MYGNYAKIRDQKGVTDYRVSVETGIPKSTFSEWKSGADYFGVSIEYFLE